MYRLAVGSTVLDSYVGKRVSVHYTKRVSDSLTSPHHRPKVSSGILPKRNHCPFPEQDVLIAYELYDNRLVLVLGDGTVFSIEFLNPCQVRIMDNDTVVKLSDRAGNTVHITCKDIPNSLYA